MLPVHSLWGPTFPPHWLSLLCGLCGPLEMHTPRLPFSPLELDTLAGKVRQAQVLELRINVCVCVCVVHDVWFVWACGHAYVCLQVCMCAVHAHESVDGHGRALQEEA